MTDEFAFENLSDRAFEQLTSALTMAVFGAGVEAFGPGPDGGRDATFRGSVDWSRFDMGSDRWNGYVVIQAKQRSVNSNAPADNLAWLSGQVRSELTAWAKRHAEGRTTPDYLLFVTNVRLSSVAGSGGIDRIDRIIADRLVDEDLKTSGIRGWKIWHRDQLDALLRRHDGIRRSFRGLLTFGDILSSLGSLLGETTAEELEAPLRAHAEQALVVERWVQFDAVGGSGRQSVESMIIDLPCPGETALNVLLRHSDPVLRASMQTAANPKHIVFTGAPGNGKSTLSQFWTQLMRARLLEGTKLTANAAAIREATFGALTRLRCTRPRHARWPFRVNLAEFADARGPGGDMSLLRWLSEKIQKQCDVAIRPNTLRKWLTEWPWTLVLDGLDEVTHPQIRHEIIGLIEGFAIMVDQLDADVLLIVTTRPTGYAEQIDPQNFRQYDLGYLGSDEATRFGASVAELRFKDDPERASRVRARLTAAAEDETRRRLLRTPLQVLIMTMVLEQAGDLPTDRSQLFTKYYDVTYQRETSKLTTLAALLRNHRDSILQIHKQAGLALQISAETSGDARAQLEQSELVRIIDHQLNQLGFAGQEVEQIREQILQASMQRLVLLVAGEENSVEFEVRSLQEFMASRAIEDGTDQQVQARLRTIASSPHWRNTFIFASGRILGEAPTHQREALVSLIEQIDSLRPEGWLCPVGPEIAADLLDDGATAFAPRWHSRIIDVALRVLDGHIPYDPHPVANALAGNGRTEHLRIRAALRGALAGRADQVAVASILVTSSDFGAYIPGTGTEAKIHAQVWYGTPLPQLVGDAPPESVGNHVRAVLDEPGMGAIPNQIQQASDSMDELEFYRTPMHGLWPVLESAITEPSHVVDAIEDEEAGSLLRTAFDTLSARGDWQIRELVAARMWPTILRRPVDAACLER